MDKLVIFHANQTSMCLHLHLCCTRCPSQLTIKAGVVVSLKE